MSVYAEQQQQQYLREALSHIYCCRAVSDQLANMSAFCCGQLMITYYDTNGGQFMTVLMLSSLVFCVHWELLVITGCAVAPALL